MYSLGKDSRPGPQRPGKWAGTGTIVLALVFLVALVFAANSNDVLGWFIAVVAVGWLILSTFVYIGVHKAARFGAEQVRLAQSTLAGVNSAGGSPASARTGPRGTTLIDDGSAGIRDLKLEHSFKIIQVQAGVIEEQLGRGTGADATTVAQALETITITAHNGQGMVKSSGGTDDGGSVSGIVLD